jgi:hypothetical protein
MVDRKQRGRDWGPGDSSKHIPSDLLLLGRSHLPKFSQTPKVAPPAGDQAFNTRTYGGHFTFKP